MMLRYEGTPDSLTARVIREPQPEPGRLRIEHPMDAGDRALMQIAPEAFSHKLKRHLTWNLAESLMKRCVICWEYDIGSPDGLAYIELALNDLGTHKQELKNERLRAEHEAITAERQRTAAVTPYGFEPGQFYE